MAKIGDQFLLPGRARKAPTKPVTFTAVRDDGHGGMMAIEAQGVLVFLDELARPEVDSAAYKAACKLYGEKPPTFGAVSDQEIYHSLARVLRDPAEPAAFLFSSVEELQSSIPDPSIARELWQQYRDFVAAEFPAWCSPAELAEMKEQAKTLFFPALLSRYGSSKMLRLLRSLDVPSGKSPTQT